MRWATREKEIKANEKNRKKASKHQRRSGSKKKTKRNRFEKMRNISFLLSFKCGPVTGERPPLVRVFLVLNAYI